ncbi:hypothetical protein F4561_002671 [Lipingzhangella halophila]|uniref:HAMP domain-containing protein n=1 Tax=Lipingzhangella halophila TaxID=1783352 RepID=A0A7W7RH14_9ACTN|nr:head fiber protein [Lipingzhangella halophila]MBB4931851.1 hypothetical protein [Lipingzhangella halophila]
MSHVAGDFTGIVRERLAELDEGAMSGEAPTVDDSTATDTAELVSDFNDLLAALRTRGVLASE